MKKPVSKISKLKLILISVVLALGGFLAYKSMMVSPQVALIANGGDQPASCVSNVGSFTATDSCGQGMVNRVDYTCLNNDKKGYEGGNKGDCIDTYSAYVRATGYCGQTCTTSTAIPAPSCVPNPCANDDRTCKLMSLPDGQIYCPIGTSGPTPRPSVPVPPPPVQSLKFSCNVKVYKLKNGDDPSVNPSAYATLDRLVDPSQVLAVPGEHYSLLVEGMSSVSVQVSTISATTENVSGSNEPIKVTATTPYCSSTDSWGKYMSCTHPGMSFTANTPIPLKLGMTIQIQNNIYEMAKTSIRFGLYNILGTVGYPSDCYATLKAAETVSTPTPVPTPPPSCYSEERFCLQGLFGGSCPSVTVCPTPSPVPSPSPTPSPSPKSSSSPSSTSIPANCIQWYDGCNTCSVNDGIISRCTRNVCRNYQPPRCLSYATPGVTATPTSSLSPKPQASTRLRFAACYRACRQNKISVIKCARSCIR